ARPANLTVVARTGSTTSAASFTVTPSIDGLQPSRGVTGTTVIITGQALAGASAVRVGSLPVPPTAVAPTQVSAVVPPTAVTGAVSVVTPAGTVTSATVFTVVRAPIITSVSPARGPIGAAVTISGANVGTVTAVDFNGAGVSSITVLSTSSVRVVVPAGAQTGRIHVANEARNATSPTDFVLPPQMVSMSPGRGLPESTVVLTGSNFTGATAIRFGGVAATLVQVDSD